MKIDFGSRKVAIYTGFTKDNTPIAVCSLQKLLIPEDVEAIGDVPCDLYFHNIESIETLINALEQLRGEMYEAIKK